MADARERQSGADTLLTREDAAHLVAEGARRYLEIIREMADEFVHGGKLRSLAVVSAAGSAIGAQWSAIPAIWHPLPAISRC